MASTAQIHAALANRRQAAVERRYHRALTSLPQAVKDRRLFLQAPPDLPSPELLSGLIKNEPDLTSTRPESAPSAPPPASVATPRAASGPAASLHRRQIRES